MRHQRRTPLIGNRSVSLTNKRLHHILEEEEYHSNNITHLSFSEKYSDKEGLENERQAEQIVPYEKNKEV